MSLPEVLIWQRVRPGIRRHPRIRRQATLASYVVDFYCDAVKLVIEVDGSSHADSVLRDEARDKVLRNRGFEVLRLPASLVLADVEAAVRMIDRRIAELAGKNEGS